jgi:UDP-N-acetylmuramate: L-alanyl-gamma-D-glutamyl-meso-diaminopimelate ligase
LHDTVLATRKNIVVCGTHGKTTTTALAAFLLRENGRDPGFLIGGVPLDPPVGNHLGAAADPFVIEGDEYDSAFFDKRSKFIHYAPHVAVLNNLEFDHADIFRDLADVQRTFAHLTRIVPRSGWVVLNGDDENLRALGPLPWTRVVRVGVGAENDVRIENFTEDPQGARFTLSWSGRHWGEVRWDLAGGFNARNAAMAATAVALALGGLDAVSLAPLARFRGVKRRQEKLVEGPGLTVIEDFGHHPTALAETLTSLRQRYPGALLTAVFEPRSNTARTKTLQAGFLSALALADEVFIGAVNRADKLKEDERFDVEAVLEHLQLQGVSATSGAKNAEVLEKLLTATLGATAGVAGRARVVVFFSNGSFDGIIAAYAAKAKQG